MKFPNNRKSVLRFFCICVLVSGAFANTVTGRTAEGQIYVTPLFDYPVAPEDISDLQSKSDWLMDHFWDGMDFSRPGSVDQNALNDAMNVYGSAAMYASKDKVKESIGRIIKNLKGNPTLTLQFTKGAEEIFFGPRAIAWIDELYIPFIKSVISEKKISDSRKARYKELLVMLQRNALGAKFPESRILLSNGSHKVLSVKAPLTLIEFGNPDCDDCKFSRMKLEMASDLMEMVSSGDLDIMFIVADCVPDEEQEVLEMLKAFPADWSAGIVYGGDDIYDIRQTPSFYILNNKGEILMKNLEVSDAVNFIRNFKEEEKSKRDNKKK